MTDRILIPFIILIGLLLVPAALAADNKVPHGGTVYVGEADLDVSSCDVHTGDEIAWWDSGNAQGTPTARSRVTDVQHFNVDTDTFKGHTGQWYALITKKPVFTVEDPTLEVALVENGMDTDPDTIKRGNLVSFKIATNLAGISQRAGSSGAPVSINLTGPNDTVFHTITSSQTGDFNLDKVYVYASPYDTGAVWDTSDAKKFPDGEYTISAVTNVNKINENNPDSGATVTEEKTYTISKTGVKGKDKSGDVKAESVTTEKKAAKKAANVSEEPTEKITSEPTPEETSSKSSKSKKSVDESETPTEKPTKKVTSEPTSEGKSNKTKKLTADELEKQENLTAQKTQKPTREPTEVQTSVVTPIPTKEVTDEPTPVITPHPKKTYAHPPTPSATATQASPLPIGVLCAALGAAALLIGSKRNQ